jgi:hypothetical protein
MSSLALLLRNRSRLVSNLLRLLPLMACATALGACTAEATDEQGAQQGDTTADALSATPDGTIAVLSVSKDNGSSPYRYSRIEAQLAISNLAYEKKVAATFTCLEGSAKGKVLSSASASYRRSLANGKEEWVAALDGIGGDSTWVIPGCNKYGVQATVTMAQKQSVSKTVSFDASAPQPRISGISAKFDKGNQSPYAFRYPQMDFSLSVLNVAYAKTVDVEVACIKNNVETDRMTVTGGKFAQAMTNNHEEWTLTMYGVGGKGALFLNSCEALAATPVLTASGHVSRGASETTVLKRP